MKKNPNSKKALFIGAACVDVVIYLERLPKTEEDLHPHRQEFSLGGCAGNAARAAKLLSDSVELASPVGSGVFRALAEQFLHEANLPIRIRVPEANGCCYCFVEDGGERTFLSVHGAEYTFRREWMRPFDEEDIAYVCVSGLEVEEPTGDALIHYLAEYPERTIVYCPGTRGIGITEKNRRLFALHPILHLNAKEAAAIAKNMAKENNMPVDADFAQSDLKKPNWEAMSEMIAASATYPQNPPKSTNAKEAVAIAENMARADNTPTDEAFLENNLKTSNRKDVPERIAASAAYPQNPLNGTDAKEIMPIAKNMAEENNMPANTDFAQSDFEKSNQEAVLGKVIEAAARLRELTENTVVVTLGELGVYCLPKEGAGFLVPAKKAKVVNTIGAGDTHAGAFIASLLNGKSLRESLKEANALAAVTVSIEAPVPERSDIG